MRMAAGEQTRIVEHLRNAGCTRREGAILVDLWRYGASTVQEIAGRLGENRVTIHSAAESLLEKGLAYETRRERKRLLVSAESNALMAFLNRKEQEIVAAKDHAEQALTLLQQLQRQTKSTPQLRLHHGVEGLKRMLESSLSAKSEVLVVTDIEKFSELVGEDFLQDYYRRRSDAGITARLIWPYCDFVRKVKNRLPAYSMQVRLSRVSRGWNVGFFCWDDKLAIKSLAEGAVTCTILESPEIAAFYQTVIFESLWHDSAPLASKKG